MFLTPNLAGTQKTQYAQCMDLSRAGKPSAEALGALLGANPEAIGPAIEAFDTYASQQSPLAAWQAVGAMAASPLRLTSYDVAKGLHTLARVSAGSDPDQARGVVDASASAWPRPLWVSQGLFREAIRLPLFANRLIEACEKHEREGHLRVLRLLEPFACSPEAAVRNFATGAEILLRPGWQMVHEFDRGTAAGSVDLAVSAEVLSVWLLLRQSVYASTPKTLMMILNSLRAENRDERIAVEGVYPCLWNKHTSYEKDSALYTDLSEREKRLVL